MKAIVNIAGVAFTIFIISFISSLRTTHSQDAHHIAIFYPMSHASMQEIEYGIKEIIKKEGSVNYVFDVYNANGDKTLLRAQAEEILQGNYACIFTIGALCSQTMYALELKRNSNIPQIFCAVDDPVKMGIVKSLISSGNHATGCIIQDKLEEQFDLLLNIKPSTKKILFVYDPAHGTGLEKIRLKLEKILHAKQIELSCVEIFQGNEISQKVQGMLHGVDVIFVYTDHTVLAGVESLINLCNRYGITLYTSELNSADKGAALSFGVHQYEHGYAAAYKALLIIQEKKDPSQIPICPVNNYKIKVNTKNMHKQGLLLTPKQLEFITSIGGIVI